MTDTSTYQSLLAATAAYFETMVDGDLARFDRLFAPTATLHGLRDGTLRVLLVADYRKLLAGNHRPRPRMRPGKRISCRSGFASATQALIKVRVRIDQTLYIDYLSFHLVSGAWRVTAKAFHIERRFT
jgi:putative lumazine-binding protein